MGADNTSKTTYSQFACIGTGFSAIGLGATLKRWYGITDIRFFERQRNLGGTWSINQYPGCACDVPSALYSFSFEPNPDWTRVLPSSQELWEYLKRVSDKYSLTQKMTFGVNVERCEWTKENRWRLYIRHYNTDHVFMHECQFLFSGSGQLVEPQDLDIPGAGTFQGPMFHSSRWNTDVDMQGKNVVVVGNGCTAAQIVPSIVGKVKHLTQVVRSKHWILPPIDGAQTKILRLLLKYLPVLMFMQRFIVFCAAENELRGFPMTEAGAKFRAHRREEAERYMRTTAPKKYHDLLIPEFEVGCKRRIFDSGYLKSLHAENLTLTNEPILEIVPEGIRTKNGVTKADVIVLANGYKTNQFMGGITVVGRGGETLRNHWDLFGGAEAYNCSAMSGFPNFFILLGPNAATGHTSAIMAAENSINYALRILKPVLDGRATVAELKREAEEKYVYRLQEDLQKTVWFSGCQSWYIKNDGEKRWNAMSYPYSQAHFWYRSVFPVWSDWDFKGSPKSNTRKASHMGTSALAFLCVGAVLALAGRYYSWDTREYLSLVQSSLSDWRKCFVSYVPLSLA